MSTVRGMHEKMYATLLVDVRVRVKERGVEIVRVRKTKLCRPICFNRSIAFIIGLRDDCMLFVLPLKSVCCATVHSVRRYIHKCLQGGSCARGCVDLPSSFRATSRMPYISSKGLK